MVNACSAPSYCLNQWLQLEPHEENAVKLIKVQKIPLIAFKILPANINNFIQTPVYQYLNLTICDFQLLRQNAREVVLFTT